ncbi:MAG: sigma-70 family RNA polymerase sigma factor [Woeseiaceae bacterium]|nr:sigma-70 family RNA polymerase sigma factor [Woeseiaceae bacterium]
MESDEKLVEQALAGSELAFSELVDRYQERLLRFLMTRCRSRADAEDAVQDTFISAYRYLYSFDARWRFSTWIYRIAIRNAARQSQRQLPAVEVPGDESTGDPLEVCIVNSLSENVWLAAKRTLSSEAYTAMWLRYVEDLSIKEIARALDRTASWTKVTLLRSRRKLSVQLDDGEAAEMKREQYGRV